MASAQARFFLSVVNPGPQDLLALDFEQNGDDTMTLAQAEQFVTEVFNQTGRYPGFYSDSLAGSLLGGSVNETLRQCWLWRAEYGAALSVPPTWPTWTMWQYTDGEHGEGPYVVPGIGGPAPATAAGSTATSMGWRGFGGTRRMPPRRRRRSGRRLTLPAS